MILIIIEISGDHPARRTAKQFAGPGEYWV